MAGEVEQGVDPKTRSHLVFANGWGSVTSRGLGTVSQGACGPLHGQPARAPLQHPKKLGQAVNEERDLPKSRGKFLSHAGGFHGEHCSEGALPVTPSGDTLLTARPTDRPL